MPDSSSQSQRITPYLYYEDVAAALVWLAEAFGFEEAKEETMRGPEGDVIHAKMRIACVWAR